MQRSLLKNQKSGKPEVTGSGFTPRSILPSLRWHTDEETDDGPATRNTGRKSRNPSVELWYTGNSRAGSATGTKYRHLFLGFNWY
ncbi:hypothetical protein Pmani_009464 [Petrolisthes manimaculis]|uniref:Uncharacterized protein n=1 Tax=Petrolisthes manimaculis TaxID=1843537 RepID=A0AAE1UCU2_9EUCA|nr:hypothetical protein Pmani_009464 [Petrolisthes manimaculis]